MATEAGDNTKSCLACRELIDADALKCHYCRQIQSNIANLQNRPWFLRLTMLGVIAFFIWLGYLIVSSIRPGVEYNNEITGVTFEVRIGELEQGNRVSCIGKLNNKSNLRWRNLRLRATFFNDKRDVIDVHSDHDQDGLLRPGKSGFFRVSGALNVTPADYAACSITIVDAANEV